MSQNPPYKTSLVLQANPVECGAICVSILLKYFQLPHKINHLKNRMEVFTEGCSSFSVVKELKAFGLKPQTKKILAHELKVSPLQLGILYFDQSHFVVFEGFFKEYFYINDPKQGRYRLNYQEFHKRFSNLAILLLPSKKKPEELYSKISVWNLCVGVIFGLTLAFWLKILTVNLDFSGIHELSVRTFLTRTALFLLLGATLFWWFYQKFSLVTFDHKIQVQLKKIYQTLPFLDSRFFEVISPYKMASEISSLRSTKQNFLKAFQALYVSLALALVLLISIIFVNKSLFFLISSFWLITLALVIIGLKKAQEPFSLYLLKNDIIAENYPQLDPKAYKKNQRAFLARINELKNKEIKSFLLQSISQFFYGFLKHIDTISFFLLTAWVFLWSYTFYLQNTLAIKDIWYAVLLVPFLTRPYFFLVDYVIKKFLYQKNQSFLQQISKSSNKKLFKFEEQSVSKLIYLEDFSLKRGENLIFNKATLKIDRGKTYALVSQALQGKSTLLQTIAQELDFSAQKALIFNPKNSFTYSLINNQSQLFHGHIVENVSLSSHINQVKKIAQSLDKANLEELYHNRPMGLLGKIENNGQNLSTGQQKRLLLARSFFHDCKLLLLDDFFFYLDSKNALKILQNIKAEQITCVFSTLNENYIKEASEVIFIHEQKIHQNSHEQLLKSSLEYQKIFNNMEASAL